MNVKMSCKNDNIIYCANPNDNHLDNFKYWENIAYQDAASKLVKAKKPEIYLNILANIESKVNIYASYFGIEIPLTLLAVLSIKDKSEFISFADKKAELTKAENKRKEAEQKKKFKDDIKKWFNCETSRIYTNYKYDFLRINDNRIETTQAVKIPIELGKRIYQSIKNKSLKVGEKVLDYSVNQVDKEIKIGCHTFSRSYLLKFGSQLV